MLCKRSLAELLTLIDAYGRVAYQDWFKDASKYYKPMLPLVYTKEIDQELIYKSRRIKVLFKYWAMKKVTNVEEAKAAIPLCRYCGQELAMPRCTEPKDAGDEWIVSCRCESCCKKYNQEKTRQSMLRLYGVTNPNGLESVRIFKSQKQKENYLLRGDEINQKRVETNRKVHGVDNVSQLESVKQAKEITTKKHYGVTNPDYDSGINIRRTKKALYEKAQKFVLYGKEFPILHISEANFITYLANYINIKYLESNRSVFEKVIDEKSRCTLIDVTIDDTLFIELKSECEFAWSDQCDNVEYFRQHAKILEYNLKPNQRYIIYVRLSDYEGHMLVLKPDMTYSLVTSAQKYDNPRFRRCFRDDIINNASQIIYATNTDMMLVRLAYRLTGKDLRI